VDEAKTDFFIQVGLLDKYIHCDPADDKIATKIILKRIKESNDLLKYFFGQSPSAFWARYLFDEGIFDDPKQVEIVENGFRTPFWPQSNYLRDIAPIEPEIVLKVIRKISTNNPIIHADLVESLAQIPSMVNDELFNIIINWFDNKYLTNWSSLSESVIHLISNLFKIGQNSLAIDLLDEFIKPINFNQGKNNERFSRSIVKSRFDLSYIQPDFWKISLPELESYDHQKIFLCLLKNLILALDAESLLENVNEGYFSRPSGWRSSIWDTSQDNDNSYKSVLLKAVRDSLFRAFDINKDLGLLLANSLINYSTSLFLRVVIYSIAINARNYPDLVERYLLDKDVIYKLEFHNDYFELLKIGFPLLSVDVKEQILKTILDGPIKEVINEYSNFFSNQNNDELQKMVSKFSDTWIMDRLWVIKQHLNPRELSILTKYIDEYGEPEHPEYLSFFSGVFTVTNKSPLDENAISDLSAEELITFITKWKPDNSNFGPIEISHRGFAEAVAKVIIDNMPKYKSILPQFSELPSAYLAEVFTLAKTRLEEGQVVPWEELLLLIEVVVGISKNIDNKEKNQNSINTRLTTLWFINSSIKNNNIFTDKFFDRLLIALKSFINDIDPDEEKDNPQEKSLGFDDPITLALNSIRPLALDAIFLLFNKIYDNSIIRSEITEVYLNEFKSILYEKFDREHESSWAVHSIFGKWALFLYSLDRVWFVKVISKIFPDEIENERYFLAAWSSYLFHNKISKDLYLILLEKYRYSIKLVSEGKKFALHSGSENRLALHLLLNYFWNPYKLSEESDSNLLLYYFSICDSEAKGSAIWSLWWLAGGIGNNEKTEYWHEIKEVWKWRTNEFILSGYSNEYYSEIQWFSYLLLKAPSIETINSLNIFIEQMLLFVDHYTVWLNLEKYLADNVEKYPEQVIRIYRTMHENRINPEFGLDHYGEEADKILKYAIHNNNCKEDAVYIVNQIGRFSQRYRKLYEENT
jgi:hypothetical protein